MQISCENLIQEVFFFQKKQYEKSIPVQEMESTPGPKYSTIAPVPPFTVKIPATFKITSVNTNTKTNKVIEICIHSSYVSLMGGMVASWLMQLTLDPAVWVRALARDIVLCSWVKHLLSLCLSPPRCLNGYQPI